MKLRMLFLTVAVLCFAAVSFGQPTSMTWNWWPGSSASFFPLTEEGTTDGTGTPLPDGTIVKIFIDNTGDGEEFDPTDDDQPTVGNGNGEYTANSFGMYGADFFGPGVIFGPLNPVLTVGSTTPVTAYLVVCCPESDQAIYYSSLFQISSGPADYYLENFFVYPGFTGCAAACEQSADLYYQPPGGGYGDVDEPDVYWCLELCGGTAAQPLIMTIGPLQEDEFPVVVVIPGCDPATSNGGCDEDCDPAVFDYNPDGWVYNPTNGYWENAIFPIEDGCVCVCLEDILAAELLGFDAIARDNSVELSWSTASEVNVDRFEILRARAGHNSTKIAAVEAGAGTYTYTDNDANNGTTYEYTLVEVDVNGATNVLSTVEATPNANLAVITEYALHQNYPNPFNPTTNIVFDVVEENRVELTVYNAVGQLVAKVANSVYGNGRHTVEFSSDNLTSGLYFYTVKIGNEFTATKKMLLVK